MNDEGRLLVNFMQNRYIDQILLILNPFCGIRLSLLVQFCGHLKIFHYSLLFAGPWIYVTSMKKHECWLYIYVRRNSLLLFMFVYFVIWRMKEEKKRKKNVWIEDVIFNIFTMHTYNV